MTDIPPPDAERIDETAPTADARPAPRTGLVVGAVASITAIFLTAIIIGAMLLSGRWSGRAEPTSSVDGFLQALLVDRDADDSASYMCQTMSYTLVDALELLETGGGDGPPPVFSWDDVTEVSNDGATAIVTADVTLDVTQTTSTWTFVVVTGDPDDTWRVCGVNVDTEDES